ncbi:MAG: hypothetical protein O6761_07870 [Thaumarchaeota archaeon]|nr:hypothetical protein [Nitrososphaerota archaeon]
MVDIPHIIPENLKLLKELKIIKEINSEAFEFVKSWYALYISLRYKMSPIVALNRSVQSYCPDLSKSEYQQVKGTIVTLLTQHDPIFCREWLIERCMAKASFTEMKGFIEYVLKHNKNIHET